MRLISLLILGAALTILLPGCGGGGAKSYHITRNTTVGQELTDLKAAYDRGALSYDEYQEAKEKILAREM